MKQLLEARRMADLAGGADILLKKAHQAFESGDAQWTCQLTDYLNIGARNESGETA